MSISSAPSSTAARTSATLIAVGYWPDGNPVATAATFTPLSAEPLAHRRHEVRVDADRGAPAARTDRDGSGRRAFEAIAAALPGVSEPSSVVRSVVRIASWSAQTFASRLIERFASDAARSSSATASTAPIRGRRASSGSSNPAGNAGAWAMR